MEKNIEAVMHQLSWGESWMSYIRESVKEFTPQDSRPVKSVINDVYRTLRDGVQDRGRQKNPEGL